MKLITPRHLLILDLDETLIHAQEVQPGELPTPDFIAFNYNIWKRPFLDRFITTITPWFDVAVWTSSSKTYADAVIPHIFPDREQLLFIWTRQQCTQCISREFNHYYWRKNLNKVKRRLKRQLEHVLIIDDSPDKLDRHYGNLIPVSPFEGDTKDTELRDILPYLDWIRTVPNVRSIDKRSWRTDVLQ